MAPKRRYKNNAERAAARNKRRREARAAMSPNERKIQRQAQSAAQRERRSKMSLEELERQRQNHAALERQRRSKISQKELVKQRPAHSAAKRKRRSQTETIGLLSPKCETNDDHKASIEVHISIILHVLQSCSSYFSHSFTN